MCVSQAIFASCIPEIIDLIGTRPKYGGTLKNEKGRRWEQSQKLQTKQQNKTKTNLKQQQQQPHQLWFIYSKYKINQHISSLTTKYHPLKQFISCVRSLFSCFFIIHFSQPKTNLSFPWLIIWFRQNLYSDS